MKFVFFVSFVPIKNQSMDDRVAVIKNSKSGDFVIVGMVIFIFYFFVYMREQHAYDMHLSHSLLPLINTPF